MDTLVSRKTSEKNRNPYSCKRCRKLKKKCTRTVPECLNCHKAGETCEYVPRASRRKKSEVLRSFNELKNNPSNDTLLHIKSTSIPDHLVATPAGRSSLNPLLNDSQQPQPHIQMLSYNNAPAIFRSPETQTLYPRTSIQDTSIQSLRRTSIAYGKTDPISYSQDSSRKSFSTLPPISTLTNTVQPPHLQHLAQQSLPPQQQLLYTHPYQQQQQHLRTSTSQLTQHQQSFLHSNSTNDAAASNSAKSSISSQDGKQLLQTRPEASSFKFAASSQNKMLHDTLGINGDQNRHNFQEIRPELNFALVMRCIECSFNEFGKSFPFIRKIDYVNRLQSFDLFQIEQMPANVSFDLFMLIFIGYTALERRGKLPVNETLKGYLRYKSLEQASGVISYNDIESIKNLLLLGLYSYFDSNGSASWCIGGIITRLTFSLGLNRKSNYNNPLQTEEEAEMRNRLFWSVYNYDRQVSLALNRPFGIRDDDISAEIPKALKLEEQDDIELLHATIHLRRIEGKIHNTVHSVNSGSRFTTVEARSEVITSLRAEIEEWYKKVTSTTYSSRKLTSANSITSWCSASYYQLIVLLYRPSFLVPNPPHVTMITVGKACLQSFTYYYNLYQIHLLPLNWVQLYMALNIGTVLTHCLCKWSVDLTDTKTELNLLLELFEYFSSYWPIAKQVLKILRQVNQIIYDNDLVDCTKCPESSKSELTSRFIDLTHDYHQILRNNHADIWLDDPILANIGV